MSEFNPDEYLKQKELEEFNPDKYLAGNSPSEMSTGRLLAKGATNTLPMAGSLAGAAIAGGPTLGLGALTGSALGAMAGKAAQTLIEENFFNEPVKPMEEKLMELPKEGAYDVVGNLTGEKILGPAANLAMKGVGKVYNKVAGGISKIPETVMETMGSRYNQVNEISDVAERADVIREGIQNDIKTFKTSQNAKIYDALREKGNVPVDIKSVKATLVDAQKRIDPRINPEWSARLQKEIDVIDSIIDRPKDDAAVVEKYLKDLDLYEKEAARAAQNNEPMQWALPQLPTRPEGQFNPAGGDDLLGLNQNLFLGDRSKNISMNELGKGNQDQLGMMAQLPNPPKFGPYGEVTANQAQQLAQRLQNLADYTADGMALKRKDLVDVVLQRAASKTRAAVQKVAPEIQEANAQLSRLHRSGKQINKNMITAEKPYNSMIGAGTGENKMAIRNLEKFQDTIGKSYLPQMQDLAAAQYFGNAGILPGEKTGSSLAPLMVSGGFGLNELRSGNMPGAILGLTTGLPFTPIGIKTTLGMKAAVQQGASKIGVTPARIGSESVQAMMPELYSQAKETLTQKAERVNQERRLIKGK